MRFSGGRLFAAVISALLSICCLAQKTRIVSGEYAYHVPENVGLEEAKRIAVERAKIQLIADQFGSVVHQSNATMVKNIDGNSQVDFLSAGGSEVRGEWIETIGAPSYRAIIDDDHLVVTVNIKGKIREIVAPSVEIKALTLRNGVEDRYDSTMFKNGDDIFLSFATPVDGYVAAYLVDEDRAFCLLPYIKQTDGNVRVKANTDYVFFSKKKAREDLARYVSEYKMTCARTQELNHIYIIFSTTPFIKPVDRSQNRELPRELSTQEFMKWLSSSRSKDINMVYKRIDVAVKQ